MKLMITFTKTTGDRKMAIVKYEGKFPELWETFKKFEKADLCTVGNKKKAYEAYEKLKLTDSQHDQMIESLLAQGREKYIAKRQGKFRAPFQQLERYLRNGRFEDEIPEELTAQESAELNQLSGDATKKRLMDRSWAAGMINPITNQPYPNCGV
jgi:hypothetical protein